jgi:hypothetical protein
MARHCTICEHEAREAVDAAIVLGSPYSEIEAQYGVSKSALSRHKRHGISPALAKVKAEREQAGPRSALERLEVLYVQASRVLVAAEQEGKASLTLSAVRELRSLVELLAKITGEIDDRPQVAVINVQTSDEWQQIRAALSQALGPYPEAARAVSTRLLELGPA